MDDLCLAGDTPVLLDLTIDPKARDGLGEGVVALEQERAEVNEGGALERGTAAREGTTLLPKAIRGLSMEALALRVGRERAAQWTNGEEQKRSAKIE